MMGPITRNPQIFCISGSQLETFVRRQVALLRFNAIWLFKEMKGRYTKLAFLAFLQLMYRW